MGAILAADFFGVVRQLAGHEATFRAELAQLHDDRFVPYPDLHLYDSGWLICLMLLRWVETPAFLQIDRNQRENPATTAVLASRPDVLMGGFSRLMPGCHVVEHRDRPKAGVLRWLLTLQGHGGAVFTTSSGRQDLRSGHGFVFDHSLVHAAANDGQDACDFLTVDFVVPADEAEVLRRTLGGVNLGPTSDGTPSPAAP